MTDYAGLNVFGAGSFDDAGAAVAAAGDVNGDGIGDFLVGEPYAEVGETSGAGAVYVVFGDGSGFAPSLGLGEIDGSNGFVVSGEDVLSPDGRFDARFYGFGSYAAGIGDVNGDGVDDIAIAARTAGYYRVSKYYDLTDDGIDNGSDYYGYASPNFVFVVFGRDVAAEGRFDPVVRAADLSGDDGIQIEGVYGVLNGIEAAGDVDGDGVDDFLISQSPVNYDADYVSIGDGGGTFYTLNDDGVVGDPPITPFDSTPPGGTLQPFFDAHAGFVVFGDAALDDAATFDVADLDGYNGFAVEVARGTGRGFGFYGEGGNDGRIPDSGLLALGDVNGDGLGDIGAGVVYAQETYYSGFNETTYSFDYYSVTQIESRGFVIFGRDVTLPADPLDPDAAPFNAALDPTAGDAPGVSELFWSSVSFFEELRLGSIDGEYVSEGFVPTSDTAGGFDFNGDGFADVAASNVNRNFLDPDLDNQNGQTGTNPDGERAIGGVGIYFGGPEGVAEDGARDADGLPSTGSIGIDPALSGPDVMIFSSDGQFRYFGVEVSSAGDVDGDGADDLLISAPNNGGRVYLVFGDPDAPQDALTTIDLDGLGDGSFDGRAYVFNGEPLDDGLYSDVVVSAAGDVNDDGFADILIGAPDSRRDFDAPGGGSVLTNPGEALLVFGGLDALEAADNADGANDNTVDVVNLGVDVVTGVLPIEVSIRDAGFTSVNLPEGDSGSTGFTFIAQRTGDLTESVSVDWEVAGFGFSSAEADDFVGGVLPSGSVAFASGEALATITVDVAGDTVIESSEQFSLTLTNPTSTGPSPISLGASQAFGFIFNDDQPVRFRADNASVTEGDPGDDRQLVMTVRRSGETQVEASVDWTLSGTGFSPADSADFEPGQFPAAGSFVFGVGETVKTLVLDIAEDVNIEGAETIRLDLSNASADIAAQIDDSIGIGTIRNDDFPPRIGVEGGGFFNEGTFGDFTPITFTILRQGDTTGVTNVSYNLNPLPFQGAFGAADGNDIAGFLPDFTGLVTFEDGESEKDVVVQVIHDGIIEPREAFELRITHVETFNGVDYDIFNPARTAFINNDDGRPPVIPPGVEADVFGDPHIITLDGLGYDFQAVGEYILVETLPGAANPFQVQVRFEPLPGSDLVSVTTRAAVEIAGKVVEIAVGDDALLIDGAPPTDEQLALGAIDLDGDGVADVFFDAALGEFTLVLNDENEQLKIGRFDGSLNVCVFLADSADGNQGNVRGLMGDADGDGTTADDIALRDGTVLAQPVDFDTLYGAFADSWRLDGTDGKAAQFSNVVSFPDGFPAGVFKVDDLPDALREAAEAAALAAGLDPAEPEIFEAAILDFALTGDADFLTGATQLAADPIADTEPANAPDLPAVIGVRADASEVLEGDSGVTPTTFTFYRTADTAGAVTVSYAVAVGLGAAVDASDLAAGTALTGTVAFADGEETQSISIGILGDLATEADEALTVSITGLSDPTALTGGASATTIVLTDDLPPVAFDDAFSAAGATASGDVTAANPTDADDDPDGDPITVTRIIDETGAASVVDGAAVTLPSGAVLTLGADGTFDYDAAGDPADTTPTDYEQAGAGDIVTETFDYEISDGQGGTARATATITLIGVNDAPEAEGESFEASEDDDAATLGNLLANDSDPEGEALSVTAARTSAGTAIAIGVDTALAGGGILRIEEDGDVVFNPSGDFEALGFNPQPEPPEALQTIVYTVGDGERSSEATLTLGVRGENDAPEVQGETFAVGEDDAEAVVGALLSNDEDAEGAELSVESVADSTGAAIALGVRTEAPEGGFVTVFADGTVAYDPAGAFEGLSPGSSVIISLGYVVTDGDLSTPGTASIEVNGVNDPPEVEDETFAVGSGAGAAAIGNVLDNDTDAEGAQLALAEVRDSSGALIAFGVPTGLPEGGVVTVLADGGVTFDPAGDFDGLAANAPAVEIALDYVATDGDATAVGTATIAVSGADQAPVLTSETFEVSEDDGPTALGNLLDNDEDPEGAELAITSVRDSGGAAVALGTEVALAFGGLLRIDPDGTVSYDPNGAFEALGDNPAPAAPAASETLTYVVGDGSEQAETTLTIGVRGVNDPPAAADDSGAGFGTDEDTAFTTASLLANDEDAEGDPLAIVAIEGIAVSAGDTVDLGSGARVTVNADGTVDYDPNGRFEGLDAGQSTTDAFEYAVGDGLEQSEATATIAISGVDDRTLVSGTSRRERVEGTSGDDVIDSGAGSLDRVSGGGGSDLFRYGADTAANGRSERDLITDFTVGDDGLLLEDGIEIAGFRAVFRGALVTLTGGDGDTILLRGDDIDSVDDLFL